MWLNFPPQMVRSLNAERRRDVAQDRPSAIVELAIAGISRVTAMTRRLVGFPSADAACADC